MKRKEWRWFGCSGHFIAARSCLFRMHTRVGDYRISSVGAYFPTSRPIGDFDDGDDIGAGRKYETMVFVVRGWGVHGEGEFVNGNEIEALGANTEEEATLNHMLMCEKYAKLQ